MERQLAAILAADMANYARLIEDDEMGTLARQKGHRTALIDPLIAERHGRIVKTTGDGLLAEFRSVQDAVTFALDVQTRMRERETDQPADNRIRYRIGINLGDVVRDDDDIFGDGVNVAARLETLAEPGGLCVSDIVHQSVPDKIGAQFRDMGSQRVKNISRPIRVWQWSPSRAQGTVKREAPRHQRVQFCRSSDGTTIAYASLGNGPPVLRAPHWMNHLEYDLRSPFHGPFLDRLARDHRLVRFDQRGNGLSDWDVEHIDADAMIADMEAVVAASGLSRFALLGISQGASFSIRYALRHPRQVTCLVLLGGYLDGRLRRKDEEERRIGKTARIMIREGWGSNLPVYRNFFTTAFLPDAPIEVQNSFDELQRITITPENASRIYEMNARLQIAEEEAAGIRVPTLVLHSSGDRVSPVSEGRRLARAIPGAEFVELPGNNHVPVESDKSFERFFERVIPFVSEHDDVG